MLWNWTTLAVVLLAAVGLPLRSWRHGAVTGFVRSHGASVGAETSLASPPPALPDPAVAWVAGRDADGATHLVLGPVRLDARGGRLDAAGERPAQGILVAVSVAGAWVFVSGDGAVTRSSRFTGPLSSLGTLPCAFSVVRATRGRMVAQDDRGGWWSTDGVRPLAPLALPRRALAVAFADATHGAAALEGGALVYTHDGARWQPVDIGTQAVLDVHATAGGIVAVTTAGPRAVTDDGLATDTRDEPPPATPERYQGDRDALAVAAHVPMRVAGGRGCLVAPPSAVETPWSHARADFVCASGGAGSTGTRRVSSVPRARFSSGRGASESAPQETTTLALPGGGQVVARVDHSFVGCLPRDDVRGEDTWPTCGPSTAHVEVRGPGGEARSERWSVQSVPVTVAGLGWYQGAWGLAVGSPEDPTVTRFYPAGRGDTVDLPRLPDGAIHACEGPTPADVAVIIQPLGWVQLHAARASAGDGAYARDLLVTMELTPTGACVRRVVGRRDGRELTLEAVAGDRLEGVAQGAVRCAWTPSAGP